MQWLQREGIRWPVNRTELLVLVEKPNNAMIRISDISMMNYFFEFYYLPLNSTWPVLRDVFYILQVGSFSRWLNQLDLTRF